MTKLQVLGTGCAKCRQLTEAAETAARELGLEYEVSKVTNINDIMAFGVMVTPALVVDGQVKVAGKAPSVEDLKVMLRAPRAACVRRVARGGGEKV